MRKRISLVLIDDTPPAPDSVVSRIRAQPGFHVLGASAEIDEALGQVRDVRPELVLLNLGRNDGAGLALAAAVHGAAPESCVILMGLEPLQADLASLIRARVSGFIMADAPFDTVLNTLHLVAQGMKVLPPELTRSLFDQLNGLGARGLS